MIRRRMNHQFLVPRRHFENLKTLQMDVSDYALIFKIYKTRIDFAKEVNPSEAIQEADILELYLFWKKVLKLEIILKMTAYYCVISCV